MTRNDFEKYITENKLTTIYLREKDCSDSYVNLTYSNETENISLYDYGCIKNKDGTYSLLSWVVGDRGYELGGIYSDNFDTEEEALDYLKTLVDYYKGYTIIHSYKDQVDLFMHSISGKSIKPPYILSFFRNEKFDFTYEQFNNLVKEYFPDLFCIYDYEKRKIIIFTKDNFVVLRIKLDLFRVIYWEYDGEEFILFNKLESTFCEYNIDADGIYVLYYNSKILFRKYDYNGKLIYQVQPDRERELRYGIINPHFFSTYYALDGKYDCQKYIGVTNGKLSGIFQRKTGKLITTF